MGDQARQALGWCARRAARSGIPYTIKDVQVRRHGDEVIISVTGNGFLYNMVRIIAGTLLEVGTGLRTVESVNEALESCNRQQAGPTAPAKGLTLIGIKYKVLGEL